LTITKRHRLTIEGNGATLHTGTVGERDRKQLALSDSDDVTVRNLGVVGSNERAGPTPDAYDPKLAFQHAFSLSGVHRVLLAGLSAARVHGDFVYIGGHSGAPSSDVTVTGSKFDGSGRQGISVTNADRVLISDNDIANVARSLFDIETNTSDDEVRDVRITGNRTGAATNFWLANKGAGDNIGPVEVDGNTMSAATGGLLFAFGTANAARGPYIVRGNQLIANDAVHDEGSVGALLFANCHDVSVVGNRVTFPPGVEMPVIELRSSRGVDISGNDFSGASQPILSDATTTGLSTSS
jgi:nitrous oxidase accessory protein NosD